MSQSSPKKDNLELYAEYNKTLRAWLVGVGFGVPALFIANEAAQKSLLNSPNAKCIIWLFLIGSASQVLMAFLNKTVAWCAYRQYQCAESSEKVGALVQCIAALENVYVIDVLFDIISLFALGWSIWLITKLWV